MDLNAHIRTFPDFPKPGILFYDISTLLKDRDVWRATIDRLHDTVAPHQPDMLAAIESRGFMVAAPLAYAMGLGFTMVRKAGKLPGPTVSHRYGLEYGEDEIEIQADALDGARRVVVIDDLLATGGTSAAAVTLLRKVGAEVVGAAYIIELAFLNGRERLDVPTSALLSYDA